MKRPEPVLQLLTLICLPIVLFIGCFNAQLTGDEPWLRAQGGGVQPSSGSSSSGVTDRDLKKYKNKKPIKVLKGEATYYSNSLAGNRTASGERYNPRAFTAASRDLPFGTVVRVIRVEGGQSVLVRINDRGPFRNRKRILDLSRAAAKELAMLKKGVVKVRAEILKYGKKKR